MKAMVLVDKGDETLSIKNKKAFTKYKAKKQELQEESKEEGNDFDEESKGHDDQGEHD